MTPKILGLDKGKRAKSIYVALLISSAWMSTRNVRAATDPTSPSNIAVLKTSNQNALADQLLYDYVKSYEGCVLVSYQDGFWVDPDTKEKIATTSIGIGHQQTPTENFHLTTYAEALAQYDIDIKDNKYIVDTWAHKNKVRLNPFQRNALVALIFNVGRGPLYGHLGKYLIDGDFEKAENQFKAWCMISDGLGGHKVSQQLLVRRGTDLAMFRGDVAKVKADMAAYAQDHISTPHKKTVHKHKKKKAPIATAALN